MSFLRRHKSSDENVHCDGIILENYIQPEITSDRRVHNVIISSILLAIVLGVAVIKLPLPSFLTGAKEGGYNPEQAIEINGDAELKQALESKVMSSYIVNNVSFTGPHIVDYFGIVANTEDFLRLDYDCRIYSKKWLNTRSVAIKNLLQNKLATVKKPSQVRVQNNIKLRRLQLR